MWGVIIAIISGACMSIQGVLNTGVTDAAGLWVTSIFVQGTALAVSVAAWLVTGREGSFVSLFTIDKKYMLLGGAIGAMITYTVIKATAQLGPARAVMFIVTSQLLVAYAIELFGLFGSQQVPFEWRKLIGMIIIIIGIIVFKFKS